MLELASHQLEALDKMKNGCILCGDVGSGKSRTALAYYYFKVCKGSMKINGKGSFKKIEEKRDLYIITTAQKRDKHEWEDELWEFILPEEIKITIDSWNNIKKYKDVIGAFFIFDEQRLVGSGTWVKTFYNIARKNKWILLSATPGDKWKDYIPVFVANGFYNNKTDFQRQHIMYDPYVTKYPKIKGYRNEVLLLKHRREILVKMKDVRHTVHHDITLMCDYNKELYSTVWRKRWNVFDDEPIQEVAKMCYLLRKVVNSDVSRQDQVVRIICEHDRTIIFYNFDYELEILRNLMNELKMPYAEWNGHKHEPVLTSARWCYLVQYMAGCEGWNCTTCDTIIFYSQDYSYKRLIQAKGRIDRMNTKYIDLYYYHLRSNAMIDKAIHQALTRGEDFVERAFAGRQILHKNEKS